MAELNDEYYMRRCIELAMLAAENDDVPVGAVVVRQSDGLIVGEGFNRREKDKSSLSHAELIAIAQASERLGGWRLVDCALYVTLEPCVMCAGALAWAQIGRIVYGAHDVKRGYGIIENCISSRSLSLLHPKTVVVGGVMEQECAGLLKDFFGKKR